MIERLAIPDVWIFTPPKFGDERGWFSETYNACTLADALQGVTFVQDNQAFSAAKGTLRALHFQRPPKAQDKLVRVLRGSVLDVAVDLRRQSPTFGRWVSHMLSAENRAQIFVPKGFAHGYLTLEPDTEVFYKVSDFYSKADEGGLVWNDPAIGVAWGIAESELMIADRDRMHPHLAELPAIF
ncbi:MAG: dTDP-4-dehydrorhamnose 3,5-epimerase [Hyphomonadaceae bacterium]